jgi:N-acetylmuramic acid 6-phosphate etherase
MDREDLRAVRALSAQRAQIAQAIRLIVKTIRRGGRVFFIGAGTSGRLGVLEAAECPPTFSTPPSLIQAVIAGGRGAVFRSREGAEDRRAEARRAMRRLVRRGDVVVGIAASGVTPFVDEALRVCARLGAATILLTCHPRAGTPAGIRIALAVGPEVLTGSTRLKAGTATKLALNRLTLGAMVQLGKTYGNLMVDVRPASAKLRARALRIIRLLTGCSESAARASLRAARGRVPIAVLMRRLGLSYREAKQLLHGSGGSLRTALGVARIAPRPAPHGPDMR